MSKVTYEAVEKILNDNHIFGEIETITDNKCVILVEWGDWKHDHLRLDWLMKENFGCENSSTDVTEEDGSDCYSGRHTYIFFK